MLAQNRSEPAALLASSADQIAEMPILVLNVHSRCNCRCVMCDIWRREKSVELRAADLQRHRESLSRLGVRWVILSGGEPLLHSDLNALCSFFHDLGIRLTLLTTGLLLTKRASAVARWFDDVIVSLDGPPAIHDAIRRVGGAFQLIQSGIAAVRQLHPAMRVTARSTVQKANHSHLRETVAAAKGATFDAISFLAADLTSEAFNRPLLWPVERQHEVGLTAAEVQVLEDEVESLIVGCSAEIRSGYISEDAPKLRRLVDHFKAYLGYAKPQSPVCNAPWVSAVIETDGSVRPCFFHRAIGNINNASLEEVVNGPDARAFRSSLDVAANPICQRCVCSLNYSRSDAGGV